MVIPLEILIPSALVAVIFLIVFIRLLTGPKSAKLTTEICEEHLTAEDPEFENYTLTFDTDQKYALATDTEGNHRYLLRGFGDRLVVQNLSEQDVSKSHKSVTVRRQDIAHSAVKFTLDTEGAI